MTKRRWLKSAIEEAKKSEVRMPWTREAIAVDPAVIAVSAVQRPVAKVSR